MREVEKENGETFIEDEVTLRLRFPKKWNTMTKGDIQKILNKYIEDEWRTKKNADDSPRKITVINIGKHHKDIDDDYVPSLDKCGEQYVPN